MCGDEIPMLDGEAGGEVASTVVDVTRSEPRVLREGAIPSPLLSNADVERKSR